MICILIYYFFSIKDDLNNDNISSRNIAIIKRNLSDNENGESKIKTIDENRYNTINMTTSILSFNNRINSKRSSSYSPSTKQSLNKIVLNNNRNHLNRRSLSDQLKPKQTIEVLTFTNHTRCGCVIKN